MSQPKPMTGPEAIYPRAADIDAAEQPVAAVDPTDDDVTEVKSTPEMPPPPPPVPPPPPGAKAEAPPPREKKPRFESILPGLIRRGIERGIEAGLSTFEKSIETGRETTDAVRERLQEVKIPKDVAATVGKAFTEAKLPRELASALFNQLDETRGDVLRILAREFREFLEATDLATELKRALTSLSFEIRTEVRFIPNEAGGVKPQVRSRTRVKRSSRREVRRSTRRKPARSREDDDDDEFEDDDD